MYDMEGPRKVSCISTKTDLILARVSDPHPFHADPDLDPRLEIFADPDPGFEIFADSGLDIFP